MTTYVRPSGAEIELQDTDNHKALAKANGWSKKDSAPEPKKEPEGYKPEVGDSVIINMKNGDLITGIVDRALKTKLAISHGEDKHDVFFKDVKDISNASEAA
jgi:hypothetical protein